MSVKVVFITNVLCHHQVYVSDILFERFGDGFSFIQMRAPIERRVALHMEGFNRKYCINYYSNNRISIDANRRLKEADVVIWGSVSYKKIKKYISKKTILLRYSERIFKPNYAKISILGKIKLRLSFSKIGHISRHTNSYLLCASAFAYADYLKFNAFRNRALKWGYFPKLDLPCRKKQYFLNNVVNICWCSRLISWKHPEYIKALASFLHDKGVNFKIHVIGDGELKHIFDDSDNCVILYGNIKSEKVREIYDICDIGVFTSDFSEGWGAGVTEAMNHECLVIASDAMGCVPFIVENHVNGLIFKNDDINSFCSCVFKAIENKEASIMMAQNGYKTILNKWNPSIAGNRLSDLILSLCKGEMKAFEEGPLSLSPIIENDWFKNYE